MFKSISLKISLVILITNILFCSVSYSSNEPAFGVSIDQRSLDLLTMASERLTGDLMAGDIRQSLSLKAKIMVNDVISDEGMSQQIPDMVFQAHIGILRLDPNMVRATLQSSLGDLQFTVTESESVAVLPDEGIFAHVNIPRQIPSSLYLPVDNGGLFTLIDLLGGVPFGLLFGNQHYDSGEGTGGTDIDFVDEIDQSELRAAIRYRGLDKTPAGMVHVVTIITTGESAPMQGIKIWILEDSLELYQISIEDVRGTETFVVIEETVRIPVASPEDFIMDTSGLTEVTDLEFMAAAYMKMVEPNIPQEPIAVDLYASLDKVAYNGSLTISTDGFDMQDSEDQLILEAEYMSQNVSWTPLHIMEYSGLPPMGHWDIMFLPDESYDTGLYSFRVRYTNSFGFTSDWLEVYDLVTVTLAPPRIVQTLPIHLGLKIPVTQKIRVTFSKPMNQQSVEDNFTLISESGRIVPGSFEWEDNTFIFTPGENLEYDSSYIARVKGEALGVDGLGLDGNFDTISDGIPYDDYVWSFITTSAPPVLSAETREDVLKTGERFEVEINFENVKDLHRFGFIMMFDPSVVEAELVEKASFKTWRPRPKNITNADQWEKVEVDNELGVIEFVCKSTRNEGISGTGNIAIVRFKALREGSVALGFDNVEIYDTKSLLINIGVEVSGIQIMDYDPLDVNKDGIVDILDFVALRNRRYTDVQSAPAVVNTTLGQNFPNPFNPETWIPYQLAEASQVFINIYNTNGRLIRTLDLGLKERGFYTDKTGSAYWDGTDSSGQKVSSGVYFYNIQTKGYTATGKMLLCE
ncbi:T9SS type A sorting domain-containing protein [Candidatus Poribacteria bacterium]|nr:T9SS type A sorting domain-containing protein [Candidatus Poribacteria bacterium]